MVQHDFHLILGKYVPFQVLADSKSLFDTLTKIRNTTEMRIMIDVDCESRM